MNVIGLDAHSASFTAAILNREGKLNLCLRRPTSEEHLIEVISKVQGPKQLVVEESHLAQWVKAVLEPYVDKLIICDPRHNRWIAKEDFANDRTSAIKLAELLRGGYIKEIYHPDDTGASLRALFLHYSDLNHQVTRFKCKLKATFRRIGMPTSGPAIYQGCSRKEYLKQLDSYSYLVHQANHLFSLVDSVERMKVETYRAMLKKTKKLSAYDLLIDIPGAGPVISMGYLAMIVTPHRFSRKNKLWRYACLGNTHHESDDVVYKRGPSKSGNRVLKWVVMQHYQAAVQRSRQLNRFKKQHRALIARGLTRKQARRHVCRSIISVVRAVWMKGEPYREEPLS
jgi:transposase